MTGPSPAGLETTPDLDRREIGAVAPLMLALVLFGFFPQPLLDVANPTIDSLMEYAGVVDDEVDVPAGSVPEHADTEEGGDH
ncbi:MAG: hypothetical protein Q8O61_16550 [Nocardioides sp.]|nr:hypothetical protein [Nocardioides sp.]